MTRRIISCAMLGLIAIAAWPAYATADTISYDEPADLSDNVSTPTDLGTFGVGVNTVSGSLGHWDTATSSWDVYDVWSATLLEGREITSITLTITNMHGFTADCYLRPQEQDVHHDTTL
ncbi:MAG: hypothetical protein ACYTG6_11570, partial [Planctomycetota bacterium]